MSPTAVSTVYRTAGSSLTSATAYRALPPSASMSPTVSFKVSSVRPATVTSAPSAAGARAVARPMPEPPPVTSAILPANCRVRACLPSPMSGGQ